MDAERSPGTTYHFDRFVLSLAHGVLRSVDGTELPLRPKSFAPLRLFVENAGRLLDRDSIMSAIRPDVFVTDDSITQCVGDIRRALGEAAPRLLQTLPRRGYRFTGEVAGRASWPMAPRRGSKRRQNRASGRASVSAGS